jgi:hypothetical protein
MDLKRRLMGDAGIMPADRAAWRTSDYVPVPVAGPIIPHGGACKAVVNRPGV